MSVNYRLAVVDADEGAAIVVASGDKLILLPRVLGAEFEGLLPDKPADLMPLLCDWPKWNAVLTRRVDASAGLFEAEGAEAAAARFLPPLAAPGKIVCIGANYHDHIAEMGIAMTPSYPYSFIKPANNTIRGSGDTVLVPRKAQMMDWEAELGVVIGTICRDVPVEDALDVVAGYTNFNDLSARDWLEKRPPVGVDWVQHKAFDGFAPMGPYLLPAQFVDDPQDLRVRLSLNGEIRQDSSTAQMVFSVAEIIAHLTTIMTLFPGDVIATGTPAGVGHGAKPPRYLRNGDEVRMEIGALGELVTPIG